MIHLFTDGAVPITTENASTGGVAWDQEGNWILGFNRYLGRCTPFEVELWGILDGLHILLSRECKRGTVQSNNTEVILALTDNRLDDSSITVLRRVQRFLRTE
ncbi:hypothetical protein Gohar_007560, partial [Gossypium harknessii]|nr:hypothetical protein [Gossypium harknessii]